LYKKDAWKILTHADNLGLAIAFPILGSLSKFEDADSLSGMVLAYLIVSMTSFILPLFLPNPGNESN